MKNSDKICAIIVSYNPDVEVFNRLLNSLAEQVCHIVIVDNCSSNGFVKWIQDRTVPSRAIVYLDDNKGLGYAYNIGIQQAKALNCSYVLFFDQDSLPSPNLVFKLMSAHHKLRVQGHQISAIGPVFRDSRTGHLSSFIRFAWFHFQQIGCDNSTLVPCDFLISSGSLCSIETLDAVGGMDDSLFIDHIDTEWFLRAHSMGYHAWGVCDAVMDHSLGESSKRIWLFRWRNVYQHKPFRYYYIFRNSILLYRRSYSPIKWLTGDIMRLIQFVLYLTFFCESRRSYFRMILMGVVDGTRGISGICHHQH